MRVHQQSLRLVLVAIALAVGVRWCVNHRLTAPSNAPARARTLGRLLRVTYPDLNKNRHRVFGDLAAVVETFPVSLTGPGKPEEVQACAVTAEFFRSIGVEPIAGRAFSSGDGLMGHEHVVILSHQLWRRHFGGSAEVIGRNIRLGGEPYRVIGILPSDFTWNNRHTDVWVAADSETYRDLQPAI
jgi:hypothetical protein